MKKIEDLYPVTICKDRYGGAYSQGLWLAWERGAEDIPDDPFSGDCECHAFWGKKDRLIGRGESPDKALQDLASRLDYKCSNCEDHRWVDQEWGHGRVPCPDCNSDPKK